MSARLGNQLPMTKPRSYYVDPKNTRFYHISSRCVRRAWLLGRDATTGQDYSHRKQLFLNHLKHLTRFFSVDVMGYALMSNHFHMVVKFDPKASMAWDDEEVARRWCAAFNGKPLNTRLDGPLRVEDFDLKQTLRYHEILMDDDRLHRCRLALSSLSKFMQHLKQPFSVWANHEDGCTGHFFETRFYSGVLLDRTDLLSCMAYVDLNPVEAGIARSLRAAEDTSVFERLAEARFNAVELEAYLAPLWWGESEEEEQTCSLRNYVEQLNLAIAQLSHPDVDLTDQMESWMVRLMNRERGRRRDIPPAFFDYV